MTREDIVALFARRQDAIARRDVPGARTAMQRHLDKAYKRFSKSWDARH